jgi:prolyl-tRNA editing enzyme YbaK/EbsC (Cys-tRNA(Pro) deacylase)
MLEVENILRKKGVEYKLIKLFGKVKNHEDAKKYIKDAESENDCKTIIAKDEKGEYYAFFLRGMMRIDFTKLKNIGREIKIVDVEELKELTGKKPGEVCPFLLKNMKIYIDKRIFQRNKIHFGSGDSKFGLEISVKDLNKIINFEIVDIVEE